MVVLAAAICSKAGKVLLSRQFLSMTRQKIESLLASFPKLIGSDAQHTFIETDVVRYVYQPLDQLYIVMITTKSSNIMEDLDTLRLFAKLVPEYCGSNSEDAVRENAFELIAAFDEVISLGYKENVTLAQVKTFTEMDSHEEKLQKIITESKINEARDEARRKADKIEREKTEARRLMMDRRGGAYSSSDYTYYEPRPSSYPETYGVTPARTPATLTPPVESRGPIASKPSRGMQLGKTRKSEDSFLKAVSSEEKLMGLPISGSAGLGAPATSAATSPTPSRSGVHVLVDERIVATLEREGGVKSLDIKGELKVTIYDPDDSKLAINTSYNKSKEIKWRLNPRINKAAFEQDGVIVPTDATKPWPVGSDNAPVILRWRLQSSDESLVPLTLNFWPNVEDGRSVVNVEYACDRPGLTLRDVRIVIPCISRETPELKADDGDVTFDPKQQRIFWSIPEVSRESGGGSLEFSIKEVDPDMFFPITVAFTSENTYANIEVVSCTHAETQQSIAYEAVSVLGVEKYIVE